MARITPQTARLLADELIKAGRARVNDRDSLIQSLLARSEATGDAAPETAIGAALMAAQPRTLTPAATAPMQPGVPFVAPKPTAEMLPAQMPAQMAAQMAAQPQPQELPVAPQRPAPRSSRYRPMLNAALADIAAAQDAMAGQKPDKMAQIRIETLRSKAQQLQDLVQAEESPEAEIPEEMRAAMEGRQARLARREELLGEQQARAPFAALLAAGAAGTQGRRGETDVEAITRILQAGFGGYDQSRRGFEEGTENIAEARDQAMIDRYNMQEKAREAAVQRARDIVGMGRAAREEAVADVRLPTQIGAEETAAELAKLNLQNAPEMAKLDRLVALARINASNREGRGDGRVDVEGRADRAETGRAAARYRGAAARYEALRAANPGATLKALREEDPKTVDDYLATRAELEGYSAELERTQGFTPYIGGRNPSVGPLSVGARKPPVPGATLAPDGKYYVKDPKKPGKWFLVE